MDVRLSESVKLKVDLRPDGVREQGPVSKTLEETMRRKLLAVALALSLIVPLPAAAQTTGGADIAVGIRQVDEGDLEAAVITLDDVVQRLLAEKGREKDLARAYVHLAVAHAGLGRIEDAKAKLREAWKNDKDTRLDSSKFSPRIIQLYEEAKQEARAAAPRPGTSTASAPSAAAPEKEGGAKKWLLIGGALAAVGVGVAVAGGSGGGVITETFFVNESQTVVRPFTMSTTGLVSVSITQGQAYVAIFPPGCGQGCTNHPNTCTPCVRSGPNVLQASLAPGTHQLSVDCRPPAPGGCAVSATYPR